MPRLLEVETLLSLWHGLVCGVGSCQSRATHYISSEEYPLKLSQDTWEKPAPRPMWYACPAHLWPVHKPIPNAEKPPVCEHCGEHRGVSWISSMTAYDRSTSYLNAWQLVLRYAEDPPDPNRPLALCLNCADDYTSYYKERWDEYYGSR